MKTFFKILLTLLILGGLGYGGWYAYNRYFAEVPQEGTVYVQSVSVITGVGPAGQRTRYSGVVEAKNIITVDPDADLAIKECFVSAGDKVKEGDPLFSYDVESMAISLEQLRLDILGLENGIQASETKVENLKKRLARIAEYKKYELQLEIQTEELEIRKKQYELSGKNQQAETMEKTLENSEVYSPVTGTIRSVRSGDSPNQDYYGDSGQDNAYITIVAGNDYCVKGTVSEQTIHTLQEGMDVRILSRVDDTVWEGSIYKINTEETKQNNNRYYYYDAGSGEQASKYDFFVELGTNEGLLMGQHVYIEPGTKEDEADNALLLPFYYVVETEAEPFVYAANDENRIEKRPVVLGDRDDETGTVAILEGLGYLDRIAFPDESVQVGMLASETSYVPEGAGLMDPADTDDYGPMTGMPMDGMPMTGMPADGMPMTGMPADGMPMTGMPMDSFEGMDGIDAYEDKDAEEIEIPLGGPQG